MLSTCDWPSAVVCGKPSTKSFIPLIPKADRDPKPLIDNLISWAKFSSFIMNNPGTERMDSPNDMPF